MAPDSSHTGGYFDFPNLTAVNRIAAAHIFSPIIKVSGRNLFFVKEFADEANRKTTDRSAT